MTILFTKTIDPAIISKTLDKGFKTKFLELINFELKTIAAFPLENKSLIFTSENGVESFFKNKFSPGINNKIYCVGSKTQLKVKSFGFSVFKTLKNAQDLRAFIAEKSNTEEFIHFCGNLSLDVLEQKLPLQNIKYQKTECYETNLLYPKTKEKFDALVFFSPSGVRSFAKHNSLENSTLFSIGETTSKELKTLTKNNIITSQEQNLNSLLKLINKHFELDDLK